MILTAAGLDTWRRSLGLSVDEFAAACDVTDRTARRWASGRQDIPEKAQNVLAEIEANMNTYVEVMTRMMTTHLMSGSITLKRYRTTQELEDSLEGGAVPLGAHAIAVSWLADELEGEGYEVRISWADEATDD